MSTESGGSSVNDSTAGGSSVGTGGSNVTTGGGMTSGSMGGDPQGSAGAQASGGSSGSHSAGGTDAGRTEAGATDAAVIQPAPDAQILACDEVKQGSGWQEVTPPGDLGDVSLITLDPLQVGTIYVQMHKGGNGMHYPTDGLYKSSNCGSTWNKVPPGRNASDQPNADGKVINIHSGSLVSLIADPVEEGLMYTATNYGPCGLWKSTNGGVDWDNVIPANLVQYLGCGGWFNALSVDPTDRKHLVGATHNGCMGAYAPNCLPETRDGGATWRLIPAPVSGSEQCGPYIHNATTMIYASGQNGVWVTADDAPNNDKPTWTKIAQGANGGDTGLFAYRASNGKYYVGSDYGVLEGSADFLTWTLDTNSPRPIAFITGTGVNMFASSRSPDIYTSKETNPNAWSKLQAGGTPPDMAGRWLAYDAQHKLFYSSMWGNGGGGPNGTPGSGGLFRLPTP
jgi:hypothetical protein